jgi:hypothetical protein
MGVQGLTEISADAFQVPEDITVVDVAIEGRRKEPHRCERLLRVVVVVPWWSPPGPCSPLVEEEMDLARTARRPPQQLDAETSSSQQVNPREGRRRCRPGKGRAGARPAVWSSGRDQSPLGGATWAVRFWGRGACATGRNRRR